MPACGASSYPPFMNKQLDLYDLMSRRVEYVRRPRVFLNNALTNVNVYDITQIHEVDVELSINVNIDLSLETITELDLELLTGIILPGFEVVSGIEEVFVQIDINVRNIEVTNVHEIDFSMSVSHNIDVYAESISLIDANAVKSTIVDIFAEVVHEISSTDIIVNKTIIAYAENIHELDVSTEISIGPTLSIGFTHSAELELQFDINIDDVEIVSVTESESSLTYATNIEVDINTVNEISIYAIDVFGKGLSNYMLSKRSDIDSSLDQIVTIDTNLDGLFYYFKLDHCVISSSSALFLNSPFKAQLANAIAPMRIVNWCPNLEPFDLKYFNFINFIFIYNINEIDEIIQDGDTTEIIIYQSDSNSVSYSF